MKKRNSIAEELFMYNIGLRDNLVRDWVISQEPLLRMDTYYCHRVLCTPKWANMVKIKEFYMNTPKGMVVDHVVPLKGKEVWGLHVHYNLQYLTADQNRRKGIKPAI